MESLRTVGRSSTSFERAGLWPRIEINDPAPHVISTSLLHLLANTIYFQFQLTSCSHQNTSFLKLLSFASKAMKDVECLNFSSIKRQRNHWTSKSLVHLYFCIIILFNDNQTQLRSDDVLARRWMKSDWHLLMARLLLGTVFDPNSPNKIL